MCPGDPVSSPGCRHFLFLIFCEDYHSCLKSGWFYHIYLKIGRRTHSLLATSSCLVIIFFSPILCTQFLRNSLTDLRCIIWSEPCWNFFCFPVLRYRGFIDFYRDILSGELLFYHKWNDVEFFRADRQKTEIVSNGL